MNSRLMQNTVLVCMLAIGLHTSADLAKLGVLVLDENTDMPIPNVKITGIFHKHGGWLYSKGSPDPNLDEAVTDANGRCKVWGSTNTGDVTCIIDPEAAGDSKQLSCYYWQMQGGGYNFRSKNFLGIWQPDNVVVTIRLQRVEHPIPLFVKHCKLNAGREVADVNNGRFALDLMVGDWLPPFGNGKHADMEFVRPPREYLGEGKSPLGFSGKSFRNSMTVKFTGEGNGLVQCNSHPSQWLRIRNAPANGYDSVYRRWEGRDKKLDWTTNFDENKCFCFRIRTRRDEKGKIVEAYYGKIYRDFELLTGTDYVVLGVRFAYYLNLTSLDRNLEWDRKTNLNPEKRRMGYEYKNNYRP